MARAPRGVPVLRARPISAAGEDATPRDRALRNRGGWRSVARASAGGAAPKPAPCADARARSERGACDMTSLVVLAGIGQLALAVASLVLPRVLGWRAETAKLRPLTRQVF